MGFSLRLVEPIDIEGVLLVPLAHHEDERGYFFESFRQEWMPPGAPAIIQGNVSFSKAGVLRGMHYHKRQADFWVVVAGRARAGLYDLREGSLTAARRRSSWTTGTGSTSRPASRTDSMR